MQNEAVLVLFFFMWYMLIFVSILFCISGLDDFFFDIYYWIRHLTRHYKKKYRHYTDLTYRQLSEVPKKNIAIMTACWHEAGVIEVMLKNNCANIDYKNYHFFVGVYPNDPDTILSVQAAALADPRIHCIIGDTPGPTNKASNLNQIYQYIKKYEHTSGNKIDIFVIHDSEDIIHPLSLKLYNYLMPRVDMIQIPVFPLAVSHFNFTHWVYNDEFAEVHTKDIIVREAIKGFVPSAGVGTAFSARAMKKLVHDNHGVPFSTHTLTEDYSTALHLRATGGLRDIFLTQRIKRSYWRKKYLLFGPYVQRKRYEYVATRELFPMTYTQAVRQKTRWILGIAIQEWAHSGWNFDRRVFYTLLHDRKATITHLINFLGYIVFGFWIIYPFWSFIRPQYPTLRDQLYNHPWAWGLIILASFLMLNRLFQHMIATYRVYGLIAAFLSIPRVFYANVINAHALLRAYNQFFNATRKKAPARWDKTDHQYPGSHILTAYKTRLGDMVIKQGKITLSQLEELLAEQNKTGEPLGELLKNNHYITEEELMQMLADQYHIPLISDTEFTLLANENIPSLSHRDYAWLLSHECYPIRYEAEKNELLITISDPSNEWLLADVLHHLPKFKVSFGLYKAGNLDKG